MFKKIVVTVAFILVSVSGIAQKDINNYKYILIPKQFEFSKSQDQYQLNSITKFLFNKYGFEAYFSDDDLPEDLKNDRCLALIAEASKKKSGMLKTRVELILTDCFGNTVITSRVGESRLKVFAKAYNQALRDALETFKKLNYNYNSTQNLKNETEEQVINDDVVAKDDSTLVGVDTTLKSNRNLGVDLSSKIYYAQPTANGFQLVNSEPRIVMILLSTAAENVFMVKDQSAIVFKADGFWYYSENNGELKEQITLNIKF